MAGPDDEMLFCGIGGGGGGGGGGPEGNLCLVSLLVGVDVVVAENFISSSSLKIWRYFLKNVLLASFFKPKLVSNVESYHVIIFVQFLPKPHQCSYIQQ